MKKRVRKRYIVEFNRCRGDSISKVIRKLERLGYEVERIPQLTTLRFWRPKGSTFTSLQSDLRGQLQRRKGSLILFSASGKAWSCNMKGNRPGDFVPV